MPIVSMRQLLDHAAENGYDMKETYGVPVEEIVTGIRHGVRKVNIDTDIRLAMTGAIRRYFAENPAKSDPRDYLKPAREAAKKICRALPVLRHRRPGEQDQGHPARQDGGALQERRTEADRSLISLSLTDQERDRSSL
jgi:hypothetical protein